LGTKFAGEVIDKLRAGEINSDLNIYIAHSLLTSSRTPQKNSAQLVALGRDAIIFRHLELPKEQRQALTEMLANAALSVSGSPTLLYIIRGMMPEFEEFVPERVLLLKRKLSEIDRRLPQREKDQRRYNALVTDGSPEEILRASLKGNDEERFWLEHEAILSALFSRRADSLREFIMKEIDDESRRNSMLDYLDAQEIAYAARRSDAEALRKLLPKIRLKEQRAHVMTEIAMLLNANGKHDEALNLLDEAQGLIKTDLQNEAKSNALLNLMLAYALIEPSRAFAIVERTIDRANDDVSKLLLLDKFVKSGFFKKGEIILNNSGSIPMDFAMLKYGKGVLALARADFSRTRAAADRFERQEFRIMARLMIAQALLGGDQSMNSRIAPINAATPQE
jgi:tetratricopeptide (TPR) repeat protein